MAKNEAKIKFTAETGGFNDAIKKSKDQMSLLNAQMKLNDTQMKATGATVEGLEQKQKLLTEQQKEQQNVINALNSKLQTAIECFGENSQEATKLRTQIANAMTAEEKMAQAVDKCNDELEEQRKAAKLADGSVDDLADGLDDVEKSSDEVEESLDDVKDSLDDVGDSADKAGSSLSQIGGTVAKGVVAGVGAMATAVGAGITKFVGLAEETKETQAALSKVRHSFLEMGDDDMGSAMDYTTDSMYALYGVLADVDRAAESSSFLAKYSKDSADLEQNIRVLTGVYAEYGDSIPTEGLAEAIQSTGEMSSVQGVLADALEWQGVNLEEFNAKLEKMGTAEERNAYIQDTLLGLYGESADAYRENNAALIAYNEQQMRSEEIMAGLGEQALPISTAFKEIGNDLLIGVGPAIGKVAEGLTGIIDGSEGAAETLAEGISDGLNVLVTGLSSAMPTITSTLSTLFPAILTMLGENLPSLATTVANLAVNLISGLSKQLPMLVKSLVGVLVTLLTTLGDQMPTLIPILVTGILDALLALFQNADQLIDGAIALIEGLVRGVIIALPKLIEMLPIIVDALFDALLNGEASIIDMLFELVPYIVVALVQMIPDLLGAIGKILSSFDTFLKQFLDKIWESLKILFGPVVDWIYDNVIVPIVDFFTGLWESIKGVFSKVGTWVYENIVSPVVNFFTGLWESIVTTFNTVIGPWIEILKNASAWVYDNIISPVVDFFKGLWRDIKGIFKGVATWFSDNVTGPVKEKFTGIWTSIKEGAKNAWQGIKNTFSKVASFFGDIFSKAWTKVKNIFSTGGKIFDGIKDGIATAFKAIVNKIIGGINKVIKVPFDAINKALGKLKKIEILKVKPFTWVNTISVPKIPLLAEGGILTKPTLNIAGEAGPEAIIPIDKLQSFMYGALEKTMQRDNVSQLVNAIEDLANRPIELSINGQKFAVATAADTDTVNGGRMVLRQRGLAL